MRCGRQLSLPTEGSIPLSPIIQDLDKMVRDVPAMPVVAQKVMHMLGDPRTTNSVLGETLQSDQSMASRILQMANSPFFGTRQKIASISNAIFVLGHAALRSLIITVCTKGLFKNPGLMEQKIWERALGTAVASKQAAADTGFMDPDEAFIGGLLHNVGQTIFTVVYKEDYKKLFEKWYNDDQGIDALIEMEKEEFGYDFTQIGVRVIQKWRLPPVYARIARRHNYKNPEVLGNEENPQAIALVGQGCLVVARLGIGRHEPDKSVDVMNSLYNQVLQLDRDRILKLVEHTLKTFSECRDQFGLK